MKREKESAQRWIEIEQFIRDHEFEEYSDWKYDDDFTTLYTEDEDGTIIAERKYVTRVTDYKSYNRDMPDESLFDPDTKYYFTKRSFDFVIFRDMTAEEYETEKTKHENNTKIKEEQEAVRTAVKEMEERHRILREQFVLGYSDFKKHQKELKMLAASAFDCLLDSRYIPYDIKANLEKYMEIADKNLDKMILLRAYVVLEGGSFFDTKWIGIEQRYKIVHKDSAKLGALYDGLVSLGYQMSEEEEQIANGTHLIFEKDEEPEKEVA